APAPNSPPDLGPADPGIPRLVRALEERLQAVLPLLKDRDEELAVSAHRVLETATTARSNFRERAKIKPPNPGAGPAAPGAFRGARPPARQEAAEKLPADPFGKTLGEAVTPLKDELVNKALDVGTRLASIYVLEPLG